MKTVLNYKKPAFWITIAAIAVCVIIAICFLTNPAKAYQIRITIPAGSTEAFCYSDEEICPNGNTLTLENGDGLGDTEVVLLPVEYRDLEKGVYEQFDEAGNVQYTSIIGEQKRESTEQEFLEMVNEYGGTQIVHFSYGAEDSVNEFHEMKDALDI